MDEIVLTPAGLLDVLAQVEEFKDFDLSIVQTLDNNIQLKVNDSIYELTPQTVLEDVDTEVVTTLSDINEEAYESLSEGIEVSESEDITSGVIKEVVKTLLVGGMVRLAGKLLKK